MTPKGYRKMRPSLSLGDPDQPRDGHGRWTDGGGGSSGGDKSIRQEARERFEAAGGPEVHKGYDEARKWIRDVRVDDDKDEAGQYGDAYDYARDQLSEAVDKFETGQYSSAYHSIEEASSAWHELKDAIRDGDSRSWSGAQFRIDALKMHIGRALDKSRGLSALAEDDPQQVQLACGMLRVVERHADGSGVVDMPVAVPAMLDLSKTKSSMKGTFNLDSKVFDQIVANFALRPGPKPVYFDHIPAAARRTTPASGFVEHAWVEDGVLWNRVELNAQAFDAVVVQRGFRAASVEIDPDKQTATGTVRGWSQGGLAITNTPATNVEFRIAASADETVGGETIVVSTPFAATKKEDKGMDVSLSTLQAENAILKAGKEESEAKAVRLTQDLETTRGVIQTLTTERDEARVEVAKLKVQLSEKSAQVVGLTSQVTVLTSERDTATKKAGELDKEKVSRDVRLAIKQAMEEGVDAALFSGSDGNEEGWLNERFKSFDAFESFLKGVPRRAGAINVSSKGPGSGIPQDLNVPADVAATLRKMGLNPALALVSKESELAAVKAAVKGA